MTYQSRVAQAAIETVRLHGQGWPWLIARQHAAAKWNVFVTDIQGLIWRLRHG